MSAYKIKTPGIECPKCKTTYNGPYAVRSQLSDDNRYLRVTISFECENADKFDMTFERWKGMTETTFEVT